MKCNLSKYIIDCLKESSSHQHPSKYLLGTGGSAEKELDESQLLLRGAVLLLIFVFLLPDL